MEVDEDCSGTIEWEEFLPVAGKFIAQKSPCEGVSSDMSPQTDMKGSREMLQTDTQVLLSKTFQEFRSRELLCK